MSENKEQRPAGTIDGFIGRLAGKTDTVLTIDEMNEVAAGGWAGEGTDHQDNEKERTSRPEQAD